MIITALNQHCNIIVIYQHYKREKNVAKSYYEIPLLFTSLKNVVWILKKEKNMKEEGKLRRCT